MPEIIFGLSNQNIDPSEYRDGLAASTKDCYHEMVAGKSHFPKRPGLTQLADSGVAKVSRGRYETFGGKVLEVIGSSVYELESDGTLTKYSGAQLNTTLPCVFTEDFSNVYIAYGRKLAKVDTTTQKVTNLAGNSPDNVTHVVFSKGFLLCNGLVSGGVEGDTNYSDDVANGYSAADSWEVFNNERLPDGCNAILTAWDAEVYSFGPNSVEVSFFSTAGTWEVLPGAYMQYGCVAPYSTAIVDNTIFWMTVADGARRIVKMVERSPVIISTPYDRLINSFSDVSDAIGWIQQIRGYSFYVIAFPTADRTFAFKLDDQTWSELTYYNTSTASYERYRGNNALYVRAWNKVIVGDRANGLIYEQGGLSDNGEGIRFELTSGQMESGTQKQKKERMLYFRVKRGFEEGGTFGYRVRDDYKQWQNEKSVSLGSLGNTKPYIKRLSGGVFRSRQYQIIHSDIDTDFIFMGLENDIEGTGR